MVFIVITGVAECTCFDLDVFKLGVTLKTAIVTSSRHIREHSITVFITIASRGSIMELGYICPLSCWIVAYPAPINHPMHDSLTNPMLRILSKQDKVNWRPSRIAL
jgi:hypothetical protein